MSPEERAQDIAFYRAIGADGDLDPARAPLHRALWKLMFYAESAEKERAALEEYRAIIRDLMTRKAYVPERKRS